MKKSARILALLLTVALLLTLCPVYVFAADYGELLRYTGLTTSENPAESCSFEISGDIFTAAVRSSDTLFTYYMLQTADANSSVTFPITGGSGSGSISLAGYDGEVDVCLWKGTAEYGDFNGVFTGSDLHLTKKDGKWAFEISKSVMIENLCRYYGTVDVSGVVSVRIDPQIRQLADELCAGLATDYEKLTAIHDWVAQNIYYDNDNLYKNTDTFYSAAQVLAGRRSVCEGYSNLVKALCDACGIPCIKVAGYAKGVSSVSDDWDEASLAQDANHAWNEAYVGGRWIIIDATWDCDNVYENGVYTTGIFRGYKYFDPNIITFTKDHRITETPKAAIAASELPYYFDTDIFLNWDSAYTGVTPSEQPAEWAAYEISKAIYKGMVPENLQSAYGTPITRSEFCELIFQLLPYLGYKQVSYRKGVFTDTDSIAILVAASLGIVNGKGDGIFEPNGLITREEAAAMLCRTAKLTDKDIESKVTGMTFVDSEEFSWWSKDAISCVSGLFGDNGKAVMGGVGGNMFSPGTEYSREQAICTIIRLYEALSQ